MPLKFVSNVVGEGDWQPEPGRRRLWLYFALPTIGVLVASGVAVGAAHVFGDGKEPPASNGLSYQRIVLVPSNSGVQVQDTTLNARWDYTLARFDHGFHYALNTAPTSTSPTLETYGPIQVNQTMRVGDVLQFCGGDKTSIHILYPSTGQTLYDGSLWGITRCA